MLQRKVDALFRAITGFSMSRMRRWRRIGVEHPERLNVVYSYGRYYHATTLLFVVPVSCLARAKHTVKWIGEAMQEQVLDLILSMFEIYEIGY